MRFDDTRDNTTNIEAVMIAGDSAEEILVGLGHSPAEADRMVNGDADDDDEPEDDGQPSEYDEWQDYMGGDDWDHGQYDECGW